MAMNAMGWILTGIGVLAIAVTLLVLPLRRGRKSPPSGRDAALEAGRKAIRQSGRSARRNGRDTIRREGYGGHVHDGGSSSDSGGIS